MLTISMEVDPGIPTSNRFVLPGEPGSQPGRGVTGDGFTTVVGKNAKARGLKRFRVNTPEKVTGTSFADSLVTDMADIKGKIGTAALNIPATNTTDLVVAIVNIINETIVSAFEVQNNAISALASQVTDRDMAINDLLEENEELRAELNNVKVIRERQEVKASVKDTEAQLREAAKQVKVLDLDLWLPHGQKAADGQGQGGPP